MSWLRWTILACCLAALTSCIEYRLDRLAGPDRYIGWARTKPDLDPKLGSKGKLYTGLGGPVQPYLGGNFSRRRLTMNLGVINYISRSASIEIGYRWNIYTVSENSTIGSRVGNVNWHSRNENDLFYFGGRINF